MGLVLASSLTASAELRGSAPSAQRQLEAARTTRQQAERHLARLQAMQSSLLARRRAVSGETDAIASQMADARKAARQRAIDAYVSGVGIDEIAAVFQSDEAADASARTAILTTQAHSAVEAAAEFQRLKDDNGPTVADLAEQIDSLARRIEQAQSDVSQAAALEADAEHAWTDARAADAAAAASARHAGAVSRTTTAAILSGSAPTTTLLPGGDPGGWAALRTCESGGDYTITSASGRYRGAYQFDQRTWESVGGTGDPAAATPAEQDLRARSLLEQRGARAWPHCGANLRT